MLIANQKKQLDRGLRCNLLHAQHRGAIFRTVVTGNRKTSLLAMDIPCKQLERELLFWKWTFSDNENVVCKLSDVLYVPHHEARCYWYSNEVWNHAAMKCSSKIETKEDVSALKITFENLPIIKIKAASGKKSRPPWLGDKKVLSLSGLVCKRYLY